MPARAFSAVRLVNGSTGDPVLYLDYPGAHNALLFDAGDNAPLSLAELGDLEAVFITHHHIDHFIGLDRILRANMDKDKTLHLFGPVQTIRRVADRVRSYEHQFFPFQKLALAVHELGEGTRRTAVLECAKRFAEPEVVEQPWISRVCYSTEHLEVEAVSVDHTAPCLAFALAERSGFHPDPDKLAAGLLRPGEWVQEALRLLRADAPGQTRLDINGGSFTLESLAKQYFVESPGARIAYVTDTQWTDELRPKLVKLARGAWRLYCDSYYARKESKNAAQHKHMMAHQAAELARLAKVEQLVLVHFAPRYAGRYPMLVEEAAEVFPRVSAEISRGPRSE
ncbi:MAG: MBL fold metallo-hydrolase [Fimbriiglobus sp.]|jgi:ribonuclease Z|nr:MBL fold metallo-hydrolase [Fimbriiglobus sp.]